MNAQPCPAEKGALRGGIKRKVFIEGRVGPGSYEPKKREIIWGLNVFWGREEHRRVLSLRLPLLPMGDGEREGLPDRWHCWSLTRKSRAGETAFLGRWSCR